MLLSDIINLASKQGLKYKYHYLDSVTNFQVLVFNKHQSRLSIYLPITNRNKTFIEVDIHV